MNSVNTLLLLVSIPMITCQLSELGLSDIDLNLESKLSSMFLNSFRKSSPLGNDIISEEEIFKNAGLNWMAENEIKETKPKSNFVSEENSFFKKAGLGWKSDREVKETNEVKEQTSSSCCTSGRCYNPCPVPMIPIVPQPPVVIPGRAVFEPVVHDHPPLHVIQKIIKKKKKKKSSTSVSTSSESDTSDSDTSSSLTSSSFEYY